MMVLKKKGLNWSKIGLWIMLILLLLFLVDLFLSGGFFE